MRKASFATALLCLLSGLGPALAGTRYSVNMSADAGGSGEEFKTIQGGALKLRAPGDELVIARGLYVGTVEVRNLRGAPNAPIVIRGLREEIPADEVGQPNVSVSKYAPVLKADKDNALVLRDCSYVRIEGLIITGAKGAGVILENCDHITFTWCDVVDNVRTQIQAKAGRRITLEDCELAGSVLEHGCRFWMTDQVVVRNCRIHHNSAAGIYLDGDKLTGGDGLIDEVVLEANLLYANGRLKRGVALPRDEKGHEIRPVSLRFGSAAISGDGVERGMIRNNLIFDNYGGGIVLYRADAARAGQFTRVLHNTIYLSADCGGAYGIYLALMSQGGTVFNNIVVTNAGPALWLGPGATRDMRSDYNVFFRLDGKTPLTREKEDLTLDRWRDLFRLDRNSLVFKPPFMDPDNSDPALRDLRLKAEGSFAGRCQFNWEAQTDFLGRWRPRDKVTPGCYELTPTDSTQGGTGPYRPGRPAGGPGTPVKDPVGPKPPKDPIDPGPIILPPID